MLLIHNEDIATSLFRGTFLKTGRVYVSKLFLSTKKTTNLIITFPILLIFVNSLAGSLHPRWYDYDDASNRKSRNKDEKLNFWPITINSYIMLFPLVFNCLEMFYILWHFICSSFVIRVQKCYNANILKFSLILHLFSQPINQQISWVCVFKSRVHSV